METDGMYSTDPIVSEEEIRKSYPWLRLRRPGEHRNRVVVSDETEWEGVSGELKLEMGNFKVVGFDLEGVSLVNYRKEMEQRRRETVELPGMVHDNLEAERPTLLQLATLSGFVVIVQLAYFKELPRSLRRILDSEDIIKVGVSIEGDAHWFWDRWGGRVKGWIDLRNVCKEAEMQVPSELELRGRMGLKHLGAIFFGESRIPIHQMKLLSYSNWARHQLTDDQLYYATFDAQIAVDICMVVVKKVIPFLDVSWDGREVSKGRKKLVQSLRAHFHRGFSRSEAPMQALKMDDLVSPNAENDERAASLREYIFDVCEALTEEGGGTETPGLERALRYVIGRNLGRLPPLVRSLVRCLEEGRPWDGVEDTCGYITTVAGKLRADRRLLLPEQNQGRYPPIQWAHVPRICEKMGGESLEELIHLEDPLHSHLINVVWELEVGILVESRRRIPRPSTPPETSSPDDSRDNNQIVSVILPRKGKKKCLVADWLEDLPDTREGPDLIAHDISYSTTHRITAAKGQENTDTEGWERVEEWVSVNGCWRCGNGRMRDVGWEPVVPLGYVQLYHHLSPRKCFCNWARLCHSCRGVWRLAQYETMLELGMACQASLESPKYLSLNKTEVIHDAVRKLKKLDKEREKRVLDRDEMDERASLYRTLKDFTGHTYIDLNKVLFQLDTEWYTVGTSREAWHESKVVWGSGLDSVSLESCFRGRFMSLCSELPERYLPSDFQVTHVCLLGTEKSLPRLMSEAELSEVAKKSVLFCDLDEAFHGNSEASTDLAEEHKTPSPPRPRHGAKNQISSSRLSGWITSSDSRRGKTLGIPPSTLSPAPHTRPTSTYPFTNGNNHNHARPPEHRHQGKMTRPLSHSHSPAVVGRGSVPSWYKDLFPSSSLPVIPNNPIPPFAVQSFTSPPPNPLPPYNHFTGQRQPSSLVASLLNPKAAGIRPLMGEPYRVEESGRMKEEARERKPLYERGRSEESGQTFPREGQGQGRGATMISGGSYGIPQYRNYSYGCRGRRGGGGYSFTPLRIQRWREAQGDTPGFPDWREAVVSSHPRAQRIRSSGSMSYHRRLEKK